MATQTERLAIIATLQGDAKAALEAIGPEAVKAQKKTSTAFKKIQRDSGKTAKEVTRDARKMGDELKQGFQRAAIAVAAATAALGVYSVSMSNAAADSEELSSKFDALFRDSSRDMRDWADEYRNQIGRGREETLAALADMRGFTEGLGLAGDESDLLSRKLTELGIDLSSFYNVEQQDTMQRLRSGLIGNAEALDVFAARISEGQLKEFGREMGVVTKDLSDQEKVLLRLQLLIQKVGVAIGDAERTSGSFQNQMRALSGGLRDARSEFGKLLNESISESIQRIGGPGKLIDLVRILNTVVAEAAVTVTELASEGLGSMAREIDNLGGAEVVILNIRVRFAELRLAIHETLQPLQRIGETVQEWHPFAAAIGGVTDSLLGGSEAVRAYDERLAEVKETQDALTASIERQRGLMSGRIEGGDDPNPLGGGTRFQEASNAVAFYTDALAESEAALADFRGGLDPATQDFIRMREELEKLRAEAEAAAGTGGTGGGGSGLAKFQEEIASLVEKAPAAREQVSLLAAEMATFGQKAAMTATETLDAIVAASTQAAAAGAQAMMTLFGNPAIGAPKISSADKAAGKANTAKWKAAAGAGATGGFASEIEAILDSAATGFGNLGAAMAGSAEEGREAWKRFSQDFIRQVVAMLAKAALLKGFGALGFNFGAQADGGVTNVVPKANGGVLPFQAFASGGIANEPTLALMGENPFYKGEAFVPLPDGKKIPVEGAGGASITFNVQANDARGFDQLLSERKDTIIGLIREAMVRDRNFRQLTGAAR